MLVELLSNVGLQPEEWGSTHLWGGCVGWRKEAGLWPLTSNLKPWSLKSGTEPPPLSLAGTSHCLRSVGIEGSQSPSLNLIKASALSPKEFIYMQNIDFSDLWGRNTILYVRSTPGGQTEQSPHPGREGHNFSGANPAISLFSLVVSPVNQNQSEEHEGTIAHQYHDQSSRDPGIRGCEMAVFPALPAPHLASSSAQAGGRSQGHWQHLCASSEQPPQAWCVTAHAQTHTQAHKHTHVHTHTSTHVPTHGHTQLSKHGIRCAWKLLLALDVITLV